MAADFSVVLDELNTTLKSIEAVLRIDDMRSEIADLEQQAAAPDLWNDVEAAQAITSQLSYLQGDLRRVEDLRSRLDDVALLHEMAEDEDDDGTLAETERELAAIRTVDRRARGAHPARPASTTPARRWSPSARRPAGSTPPTWPRC